MALINIVKGMADGAEAIQANFTAIGEIKNGTNANGTYVKFADGTMVCYGRVVALLVSAWIEILLRCVRQRRMERRTPRECVD